MSEFEDLSKDITQQFIDKPEDWRKFLGEINKSIKKFKPSIEDKDLYSYDTLCNEVLSAALDVTKKAADQGQTIPPDMILKEIYKRLIMNKVKDAKIDIKPKDINAN